MKKLLYTLLIFLCLWLPGAIPRESYDIVIYGGGFAGCAAARSATALAPGKKVLLIVPESRRLLGGLGTAGGQNFMDIRLWQGKLVTAGSFARWYEKAGQFYSTEKLAGIISQELAGRPKLSIVYGADITRVSAREGRLQSIILTEMASGGKEPLQWKSRGKTIEGRVFVDASDDGRLARLAGANLSVGRSDWPAAFLPADEGTEDAQRRQQAATLMFKVKGVQIPDKPGPSGEWVFTRDAYGSWGAAGGKETWSSNPVVREFNYKYGPRGFAIKPINAAQDGAGSEEWWVNTLLIFDVDARAHQRDKGTPAYPQDVRPDSRTTDQAWEEARDLLSKPDFIQALRQFKGQADSGEIGFGQAELVRNSQGEPVVGETLYLREAVHGQLSSLPDSRGTEDSNYAVTRLEAQKAGSFPQEGADQANYQTRIGLGYYMMDINAYRYQDLQAQGAFQWPVTRWLRPDWWQEGGEPVNPVYLPWEMLAAKPLDNLLICGYAAGCSSFAWAELRVLPNLAVLGDAAGVTAVRAVIYNELPSGFGPEQIEWVQEKLRLIGARLDK